MRASALASRPSYAGCWLRCGGRGGGCGWGRSAGVTAQRLARRVWCAGTNCPHGRRPKPPQPRNVRGATAWRRCSLAPSTMRTRPFNLALSAPPAPALLPSAPSAAPIHLQLPQQERRGAQPLVPGAVAAGGHLQPHGGAHAGRAAANDDVHRHVSGRRGRRPRAGALMRGGAARGRGRQQVVCAHTARVQF